MRYVRYINTHSFIHSFINSREFPLFSMKKYRIWWIQILGVYPLYYQLDSDKERRANEKSCGFTRCTINRCWMFCQNGERIHISRRAASEFFFKKWVSILLGWSHQDTYVRAQLDFKIPNEGLDMLHSLCSYFLSESYTEFDVCLSDKISKMAERTWCRQAEMQLNFNDSYFPWQS